MTHQQQPPTSISGFFGRFNKTNNKVLGFVLKVMKDPKINLVVNAFLMIFGLVMAGSQFLQGHDSIALTLLISSIGYITAIFFWGIILLTGGVKK